MSERLERFLALSSALTGYGRVQLLGTGMADVYLRTVDETLPLGTLDELLTAFESRDADDREAAAAGVLEDPELGPVARNLILMWYCGTWTAPPDDRRRAKGVSPLDTHRVVSADAYLAGLQWIAAGAHPVGGRQQGYAAWAVPPEVVGR